MSLDQFGLLPASADGRRLELLRGRVFARTIVGPSDGEVAAAIGSELVSRCRAKTLGIVRSSTHYVLFRDPDSILCPDVSFVRTSRLGNETVLHGAVTQVPDLAVEVTSPSDRDRDLQEKVDDYLRGGVLRVWVVRPELRTVTVHRPGGDAHTFTMGDTLTADDAAIPDDAFTLPVADIFA